MTLGNVCIHTFVVAQANAFRNSHRIYISGPDVPEPMRSFGELGQSYSLPPYILKNVASVGYSEPTPIQMQGIPLMLQVGCNRPFKLVFNRCSIDIVLELNNIRCCLLFRVVNSWHVHLQVLGRQLHSLFPFLPT